MCATSASDKPDALSALILNLLKRLVKSVHQNLNIWDVDHIRLEAN